MKLDLTKPVQTRSGKPVRILCTDRLGEQPIIGLIKYKNDYELTGYWRKNGSYQFNEEISPNDLVNVPQRHKHADLMIAYANDTSLKFEYRDLVDGAWYPITYPSWEETYEYRIKPR